jgi:hypothetical protein
MSSSTSILRRGGKSDRSESSRRRRSFVVFRPRAVFAAAIALRVVLLLYGLVQDAYSPIKYTDIDYFVFTDAARYVAQGQSPYQRDTYRYTPLLAWLLLPCTWTWGSGWGWWRGWGRGQEGAGASAGDGAGSSSSSSSSSSSAWFHVGKLMFAAGDIVAGWLIARILRATSSASAGKPAAMAMTTATPTTKGIKRLQVAKEKKEEKEEEGEDKEIEEEDYEGVEEEEEEDDARALKFASLWLLNPMVAAISTRGSSEGLLGAVVAALLWAVLRGRVALAGALLGFAVHFKIYPFIYGVSILCWLDGRHAADDNDGDEANRGDDGDEYGARDGGGKVKTRRRRGMMKSGKRREGSGSTLSQLRLRQDGGASSLAWWLERLVDFWNPARVTFVATSLATFTGLNAVMFAMYVLGGLAIFPSCSLPLPPIFPVPREKPPAFFFPGIV